MAGIELGKRIAESKAVYSDKITSTQEAIAFCKSHSARLIAEGLQEEFHIVTLNRKHRMIDSHQITVGTLDTSLVHPREVFRGNSPRHCLAGMRMLTPDGDLAKVKGTKPALSDHNYVARNARRLHRPRRITLQANCRRCARPKRRRSRY